MEITKKAGDSLLLNVPLIDIIVLNVVLIVSSLDYTFTKQTSIQYTRTHHVVHLFKTFLHFAQKEKYSTLPLLEKSWPSLVICSEDF